MNITERLDALARYADEQGLGNAAAVIRRSVHDLDKIGVDKLEATVFPPIVAGITDEHPVEPDAPVHDGGAEPPADETPAFPPVVAGITDEHPVEPDAPVHDGGAEPPADETPAQEPGA